MSMLKVQNNSSSVNLFYEDWGSGTPVVFIHGWPVSHEMWEYQLSELPKHGLRCIAYDRRGFGKSDKPWEGYDYDTLTSDLNGLVEGLDLKDVTLVGFSMGGGEVARYLGTYGSSRISKAVFVSSVAPILIHRADNPEGVPHAQFDKIVESLINDRPAFLSMFGKQFYGAGSSSKPVSAEILQWTSNLALCASPKATIDCVRSFSETDFRQDLKKIDVCTLVIHGDADKNVPFDTTGKVTAQLVKGAKLSIFEGAPHGLFITEKERLNSELLSFIKKGS